MENYKNNIMNKKSLSYEVSQYIKEQIIEGNIELGSQLKVQELIKQLGISQTPVREAIQHLVGENIIVNIRNKGHFVKQYTENDIFEIYSLRAMLEALAIRLASQKATQKEIDELEVIFQQMKVKLNDDSIFSLSNDSSKIHEYIFQMSRHERLIKVHDTISFQVAIVNSILGSTYSKQVEIDEHEELIEAIKNRDPDIAEDIMRKHIFRSYKNFLDTDQKKYFTNNKLEIFPI